MDSILLSLIVLLAGASLWWFMSRKVEVRYMKVRLLGVEIDRAIFINRFKKSKNSVKVKRHRDVDRNGLNHVD